jgi:hypothetical protein
MSNRRGDGIFMMDEEDSEMQNEYGDDERATN